MFNIFCNSLFSLKLGFTFPLFKSVETFPDKVFIIWVTRSNFLVTPLSLNSLIGSLSKYDLLFLYKLSAISRRVFPSFISVIKFFLVYPVPSNKPDKGASSKALLAIFPEIKFNLFLSFGL